jgi:hypothetical protein
MRSPVYSMMRSPASILRVAKTPLPWMGERWTLQGGFGDLELESVLVMMLEWVV